VIGPGRQRLLGRGPAAGAGVGERVDAVDGRDQRARRVQVLAHQRQREAAVEAARQHELLDLDLGRIVATGRRVEQPVGRRRIDAEALRGDQCLAGRQQPGRRHVVVQRLQRMPRARRPDVQDRAAELREQRLRPLDVRRQTAHHDRQRGVQRPSHAARHRSVDHRDAPRGEPRVVVAGAIGVGRSHVEQQRTGPQAAGEAVVPQQRVDDAAVGQHQHDRVAGIGERERVGRDLDAGGRREAVGRLPAPVVHPHRIAGCRQVAGHRPSHLPDADEADRRAHQTPCSLNTSRAIRKLSIAAGTPQ
jgi:hypothetical protein